MIQKIIITLIIVVLLTQGTGFSQDKFIEGTIKVGDKTYLCKETKGKYSRIMITNATNSLYKQKSPSLNIWKESYLSLLDCKTFDQIGVLVRELFSQHRIEELALYPPLSIEYFLNDKGKVLELRFDILKDSSTIKPIEISILEDEIKSKITFSFTKQGQFKGNFIPFFHSLSFTKILNHQSLCDSQ